MKRLIFSFAGMMLIAGLIVPQAVSAQLGTVASSSNQSSGIYTKEVRGMALRFSNICTDNTYFGIGERDYVLGTGGVFLLQQYLYSTGHLNVQPTGYFGPLTLEAVKKFQKTYSVPPTGFVGPMTRAKIWALTCKETSNASGQGTSQNIKIISPLVGGLWKFGETKEISWQPMTQNKTVDIQLLPHTNCKKDPCPLMLIKPYDIALKISADKPFTWNVGDAVDTRIIPQGAYNISVCLNGIPRECATSDIQVTIE